MIETDLGLQALLAGPREQLEWLEAQSVDWQEALGDNAYRVYFEPCAQLALMHLVARQLAHEDLTLAAPADAPSTPPISPTSLQASLSSSLPLARENGSGPAADGVTGGRLRTDYAAASGDEQPLEGVSDVEMAEEMGCPPILVDACGERARGYVFTARLRSSELVRFASAQPMYDDWLCLHGLMPSEMPSSLDRIEVRLSDIVWVSAVKREVRADA